jgi:hypothetical protein
MNQTDYKLQRIDEAIKHNQRLIEKVETLHRLMENPDFQDIILQGYFRDEAYNLVMQKAEPASRTPERQEDIIMSIEAISRLNEYFRAIELMGNTAKQSIEAHEDLREEVISEAANGASTVN